MQIRETLILIKKKQTEGQRQQLGKTFLLLLRQKALSWQCKADCWAKIYYIYTHTIYILYIQPDVNCRVSVDAENLGLSRSRLLKIQWVGKKKEGTQRWSTERVCVCMCGLVLIEVEGPRQVKPPLVLLRPVPRALHRHRGVAETGNLCPRLRPVSELQQLTVSDL